MMDHQLVLKNSKLNSNSIGHTRQREGEEKLSKESLR
jgi:hypothetical protein